MATAARCRSGLLSPLQDKMFQSRGAAEHTLDHAGTVYKALLLMPSGALNQHLTECMQLFIKMKFSGLPHRQWPHDMACAVVCWWAPDP